MKQDIETRLRASLQPVAPSNEFSQRLLARVAAQPGQRQAARTAPRGLSRRSTWWLSAGIAASLLLAAGVQYQMQQTRERANGLEARRQVVEALRMTSQKLNLAYETVKSESGV
ncbi:MAG TPA: hypothetical protein VGI65_02665 [Steroidobacteraceae bacterium]|jgi:hypothetical protein